jgi:hypothetical protein
LVVSETIRNFAVENIENDEKIQVSRHHRAGRKLFGGKATVRIEGDYLL